MSQTGTEFRYATPNDAALILRFWSESGASIGVTDDVEQIRRIATNPAAVLLLAVVGDEIVGTLLGAYDGWRGNMYRLVVDPRRRRQGLGRELVRRVEQVFTQWGVRRITVLVEADRPWAVDFWTAIGYPRDERIVRHLGVLESGTIEAS
ncbi:MAG TPA: GNAT family N-acetyltransferase [Vicinamibacterales bacterium]